MTAKEYSRSSNVLERNKKRVCDKMKSVFENKRQPTAEIINESTVGGLCGENLWKLNYESSRLLQNERFSWKCS